jgi:hypothetical protein
MRVKQVEEPLLDRENAIALDYIISAPFNPNLMRTKQEEEGRNRLTVKLKNAVMYYIVKNKEKNKQPKITDILQ